jgi:hypothetical protein
LPTGLSISSSGTGKAVRELEISETAAGSSGVDNGAQKWTAIAGTYLEDVVAEWAVRAGYHFTNGMPKGEKTKLLASDSYRGDFVSAVTALVNSLPARIKLRVQIVPENDPPLIIISPEETRQ